MCAVQPFSCNLAWQPRHHAHKGEARCRSPCSLSDTHLKSFQMYKCESVNPKPCPYPGTCSLIPRSLSRLHDNYMVSASRCQCLSSAAPLRVVHGGSFSVGDEGNGRG
jgi:hypothetical protein